MNTTDGWVPQGFRMAGVHCGIKKQAQREDLTLIVSDEDAVAAGVYTQNLVFAAPVAWDRPRTPTDRCRAVLVNSGNANACTGERGWQDACRMAAWAAQSCGAEPEQALVMSTGIIGEYLPMDRIAEGLAQATSRLAGNDEAFRSAARGILTTDHGLKIGHRPWSLGNATARLAGMAKGAGMIGPRMATMLAVLLTDARLSPQDAQTALQYAVDRSFNCISVEGHMSTNDTVLLLASGKAATNGEPLANEQLASFRETLTELCIDLARQIPNDGEGASHLITVDVQGCRTRVDARQIAQTIANSALVKTAITGADPNWGRIVSAAGYAGVTFDPTRVDLHLNGTRIYRQGQPAPFDAKAVSDNIHQNRETQILLSLGEGDASVRFWTSDLTVDYVKFNADYRT